MIFQKELVSVPIENAREYLAKQTRAELIANAVGAVLSLAGGVFIFFLIVCFSFMGTVVASMSGSHIWLWIALGVSAFSFIAYAFTDPEYLSRLEVRTVDGRPAYHIQLPGGWSLSNADYLNPKTQQALAKIVLQVLTSGPRALAASWRYAKRAAGVRQIDPDSIAGMFKVLVERGKRVPYDELAGLALRDPEKAFADLLLLDVAQHLPTKPEGMVITSKCREKFTGIKTDGTDF